MYVTANGAQLRLSGNSVYWVPGHKAGTINGTSGNDTFYAVDGDKLVGGKGDDIYYTWTSNVSIVETAGQGVDTLYSYAYGVTALAANVENLFLAGSDSRIGIGNALSNILVAAPRGSTLVGGGGDDVFVGDAGRDMFVVKAGDGSDAVEKFVHGQDLVSLEGYGIANFKALLALARQDGADVRISLPNGEQLVLRGVDLPTLSAVDFRFVDAVSTNVVSAASATSAATSTAKAPSGQTTISGPTAGWEKNGWHILDNAWNTGSLKNGVDYTIGASFNTGNVVDGATFNWSFPVKALSVATPTTILAYPDVVVGVSPFSGTTSAPAASQAFPVQVGSLTALSTKYDVGYSGNTAGFNVSYDLWFTSVAGGNQSTITNEVMIWLHKGNLEAFGERIGTYQDGDFAATIYYDAASHYTAIVANNDNYSGQIDLLKLLGKLQDLGIVSKSEYLAMINLGAEVASGAGSLVVNSLSYDVQTDNGNGTVTTKTITGSGTTAHTSNLITTLDGTAGNDSLVATGLHNELHGHAGDDRLEASATAADNTLYGGTGNDTYVVHSTADKVVENPGEGIDTVITTATFTLPDNVENLSGQGKGDLVLIGNALDNTITGTDGSNVIVGGAGADTMIGGKGNDYYHVDNAKDVVVEAAGQGYDIVIASASYALGAGQEIEALQTNDPAGTAPINLTGNEFANYITGNAGNNMLDGGDGNDILWGGGGRDTLIGGKGNDTIYVDSADDTVIEAIGGGYDTVITDVSYTLGAGQEIEFLRTRLQGDKTAINLTGNEFANILSGNEGNNILDGGNGDDGLYGNGGNDTLIGGLGNDILNGGTGADTMIGGKGDDKYVVDNTKDVVIEAVGEGYDTVITSVSYTLGAGQEIEALRTDNAAGTAALHLTGNEFANYITGNAGDNVLDGGDGSDTLWGGGGRDTLIGGKGDDTFFVDSADDTVIEAIGGGYDTVITDVSYTLGAGQEIEFLRTRLQGEKTAINLTGNELANKINGNAGDNILDGGAGNDDLWGGDGNDILIGGKGSDVLAGGAGNDIFRFMPGDFGTLASGGYDRITDFGQGDRIDLSALESQVSGGHLSFIGTQGFTGHAGQIGYYDDGKDTFVSGDLDGDKVADFVIKVSGHHAMTSEHFIL